MIQYENIQKAMGVDIAISKRMSQEIYKWTMMYTNEAPWLNENVKSLNIPSAICAEIARLATMEAKIVISGSPRAELISKALEPFLSNLQVYVEYACASGGIVFKPYLDNRGLAVDVVRSGYYYPTEFDSAGNITGIIFPEFKRVGKKLYTRLEYQLLSGDEYIVVNKAFVSRKAAVRMDNIINLGAEIKLSEIDEWANIEPYTEMRHADRTLFAHFKIPMANNIDPESPLGMSVFAKSVNQIKDADEQYGSAIWEFKAKETAIQAADEFFKKDRMGKVQIPRGKERIYHAMGPNICNDTGNPFFNVYSPEIRDKSYFNGLNRILQKIEFNSGLAYGTLSDPQIIEKTAEEIKMSKQRSYSTIKAIQNSLGKSIKILVDAMDAWLTIEEIVPPGKVEASSSWDDSLVVDKKYELEQLRADLGIGAISLVEYRMKRFNETREQAEQAVENLPEQNVVME